MQTSDAFSDAKQVVFGKNYTRDALGVLAADFKGDGLRDLSDCHRQTAANVQKDLLLLQVGVSASGEISGAAAV